ncbi:Phycocyanin [Stanieria cyanosphaera PCC 7437]|uniref:Phycocyanin n=1 Tax=Stanieria cyanosphaera (strain ATCC 29371 / PCC 7437) TaxID=111780 RepID=K9XWT9_STAC7|nr:phycocyanin [Stanieria cyanosphaera]AFZ36551.1 Phycocyanin [Stanieria cyanosphaera PCC 7437]
MLSDRIKELIQKSRIVSFADWQKQYSNEVIEIFQQADDQGRYLSDQDIKQIQTLTPQLTTSTTQAQLLRDRVEEIVSQARAEVLAAYPQITEPGGDLYPPARAEACWRDFWHFLRCITYGIAGQSVEYTSTTGLGYMEQLYQELKVPLEAMVLGLEKLKYYSLQQFEEQEKIQLAPYFEHLINKMKGFSLTAA